MNFLLVFDFAKFIPLISVLAIAAIQDYKTGHATNKLWSYAPIGLALTLIELYFNPTLFAPFGIAATITIGLSLTLFYLGAWGGADTKAFLTIAISAPLTPLLTGFPIITALTTLMIAALTALPVILIKRQKTIRYLPYILIGLIGSLIL